MVEKGRKTFRVRQIPSRFDRHRLVEVLKYVLDHDGTTNQITVHSLAPDIESHENPPTRVATVCFRELPAALQSDKTAWAFYFLEYDILIDTHFMGFTLLNDVQEDEHVLDCFAVSGLASHPIGSWKSRNNTDDFLWLRDALPKRFPGIRCIAYGYDTGISESHSFKNVEDISIALTKELMSIGCSLPSAKPIVFLAHSLGGIVLKQALVQMAASDAPGRFLSSRVKEIIFLGVPHQGMEISHLRHMVENRPNQKLVECLSEASPYLKRLDEQFGGISFHRGTRLVSVYETQESRTPQKAIDGQWRREGPFKRLVESSSAIHPASKPEDIYPIDRNHSDLVKFWEGEPELQVILSFLAELYTSNRYGKHTSDATFQSTDSLRASLAFHTTASSTPQHLWGVRAGSLRQSLSMETTTERYDDVDTAHRETFGWVSKTGHVGFVEWLHGDGALFWISGKPGSGRSTIMKHICEHSSLSNDTAKFDEDIEAKFVFSHRGSHMRKSFEGLLHCILYQLLSRSDHLTNILLQVEDESIGRATRKWTLVTLQRAFFAILEQQRKKIRIVLFLDALDEYHGNPEIIARFLLDAVAKSVRSSTRFKVCFASRPWDVFNDNFHQTHGFRMEDHTELDIKHYVEGRMKQHRKAGQMLRDSNLPTRIAFERLKDQISERAEGVFLWVQLVLDRLLYDLTDGATLMELHKVVDSLPGALEDLYLAILKRIDMRYSREGYMMLEMVLRSEKPLTLSEFDSAVKCVLSGPGRTSQYPCDQGVDVDTLARRVRSRCGGLIEVRPEAVQLMHQTVKEFLLRPSTSTCLVSTGDELQGRNGHTFLAQYHLSILAHCQRTDQVSRVQRLDLCMYHAKQAELSTGISAAILLDNIRDRCFSGTARGFYVCFPINSTLSFAVLADLRIHVRDLLAKPNHRSSNLDILLGQVMVRQASLSHGWDPRNDPDHLMQRLDGFQEDRRLPRFLLTCLNTDFSEMIRLLLKYGADPAKCVDRSLLTTVSIGQADPLSSYGYANNIDSGKTPFQMLFESWSPSRAAPMINESSQPRTHRGESWVNMARVLLEKPGACVNDKMVWPLHVACESASFDMMQLLLDKGAKANLANLSNLSPLDVLLGQWHQSHDILYECAMLLLGHGGVSEMFQISTERQLSEHIWKRK